MASRLSRSVLVLLAWASSAVATHAQHARLVPVDPPMRKPAPDLPAPGGRRAIEGDSPLTELARFAGHVGVFVQGKAYEAGGPTGGLFSVVGIPAGATIRRAWLLVTSFDLASGNAVSGVFAGSPFGPKLADVVDPDGGLYCSLYRFEVTSSIGGNGSYAYAASGQHNAWGDALVVVYEHPSLPLRTIAVHDGAESLLLHTTTTTFRGMPCTSGALTLFTTADNQSGPEEVRLNGALVAGPADLFHANLGPFASLLTIPVAVESGDNTMALTTSDDWLGLNLAVLSAEGVRLDFEQEDDFATPLVNGQSLSSPPEFGRLASLASAGANAGAAIFDSTPAGPNDPSQDRDLLVGLGNVLILQNSQVPAQTVPGVFDRPNDDQDGGDLSFHFTQPVRPRCLVLIDIDAGTSQASSVTLTDGAGRTRVYTVPSRWTEDLLADGGPAWRTLDLETLAPQPGFLSTATASQAAGFDPAHVSDLRVHLGSSGAVDDLVFTSP